MTVERARAARLQRDRRASRHLMYTRRFVARDGEKKPTVGRDRNMVDRTRVPGELMHQLSGCRVPHRRTGVLCVTYFAVCERDERRVFRHAGGSNGTMWHESAQLAAADVP